MTYRGKTSKGVELMKYMPSSRFGLFDDMFDDFFSLNSRNFDVMKTDIHEKDGYYNLDVELPGYNKEDVKMEITNGYLTISANHNFTNEEKDAKGNLVRSERSFGSCSRSFYVGDNIKADDIKAKFDNGMLNILLPSAKQKAIETKEVIQIN